MATLWTQVAHFFSVNQIAFTLLGYPMSYVELLGTLFNLWSVWLVARTNILTWPVGIVGVLLFLVLFYQIRLYADTLEQVYYLGACAYGWWSWARGRSAGTAGTLSLRNSSQRAIISSAGITLGLSIVLGYITSRLHVWLPALFPAPASFPYLDALTTTMSFTATLLMAQRRVECWVYWIIVDVIGIGLYYAKDVRFIAVLYAIFLILATNGLLSWLSKRQQQGFVPA